MKTRYLQLGNTKDDLPTFLYCRCCAFYFPSVLRALSTSTVFWKDMNELYNRLSRHGDMIIRRSLAYSIHEVAEIIGVKNTEKFLITVQGRFLQDIDDVKMGVIQNMAKFWKSLTPSTRTIQAFVCSIVYSFFSFIISLSHSFFHSFIHSLIHSFTHSNTTLSLTLSLSHSNTTHS